MNFRFALLFFCACSLSLFAYEDDDVNDEDDDEWEDRTSYVSYAGMGFICDWGCGDPQFDNTMCVIEYLSYDWLSKPIDWRASDSWRDKLYIQRYSLIPWEFSTYYNDDVGSCLFEDQDEETHDEFLRGVANFRADLHSAYRDCERKIEKCRRELESVHSLAARGASFIQFTEEEVFGYEKNCWNGCFSVDRAIEYKQNEMAYLLEDLKKIEHYFDYAEKTFQVIDSLFKEIFTWCLENHQPEGIAFNAAVENFLSGDLDQAFAHLRFLIDLAEKKRYDNSLISKLYFLKGQVQGEFCLYADAIATLTKAIQKNPEYKEAYLERAFAYFETGNYDCALQDYLRQRNLGFFETLASGKSAQFGKGFLEGVRNGIEISFSEFIPSTLASFRGIGNFIWATLQDPIEAPRKVITSAMEVCDRLAKCSFEELADFFVPEIERLVSHWEQMDFQQRGQAFGYIIGKYGVDFLSQIALQEGFFLSLRELKNGDKLATLESLSKTSKKVETVAASTRFAQKREGQFSKLKIEIDKQKKHIRGIPNFKEGKSEWIHPDPQGLLDKFAGKGRKYGEGEYGQPGYREKVNFGEPVGIHVDREGKPTPTTWGTIHYSKKGAHIVPALPDPSP